MVRCIRCSFYDLILDLRPDSPSFGQSFGAELNVENRLMMYVPRGFAHAILTLEDDAEALYFSTNFYAPGQERGVRWNDPRFAIEWPVTPLEISAKDGAWPDFGTAFHRVDQLTGLM
jgi:dTDP-4-dehydrorhamnose 3,5-epimerase